MDSVVGIGTILLIILIGGGVVAVVRVIVRSALRVGNLASVLSGVIKKADLEAQTTPKSLSSAEPLLLDRIRRDFPEYNPELIRQRVVKDAKTFYESAQAGRCLYGDGISDQLRERLTSFLPPDVNRDIRVHKAALAAYDDASEDRVLTFQAAASFKDAAGTVRQRRLILKYLAAWSTDTVTLRRPRAHRGVQGLPVLRHRPEGLGRHRLAADGSTGGLRLFFCTFSLYTKRKSAKKRNLRRNIGNAAKTEYLLKVLLGGFSFKKSRIFLFYSYEQSVKKQEKPSGAITRCGILACKIWEEMHKIWNPTTPFPT